MSELGIGLIGCGRWGKRLANMVEAEVSGARMVAVQNRTFSRAEEFAQELGVKAHRTAQDVIGDPAVDAILIVSPHNEHEPVTVAAAAAGKHIFCDKPLAINVQQCRSMVDAAEKHGVKLVCGHNTRLFPTHWQAAEIVKSGRLGKLAAISGANLSHINRVNWWAKLETMGTFLHSPAVHVIDYMLFVGGKACSVQAVESKVKIQPDVEFQDTAFLLIEFESGAIGSIQASVSCPVPGAGHGYHILGSEASLQFDQGATAITIVGMDKKKEVIEVEPNGYEKQCDIGNRRELETFVNWITKGEEPLLTGQDGLRAVEIIDAAYLSMRERKAIDLPLPVA